MFIDPAVNMKPEPLRYSPFKALVVPRPIGWITTMSAAGDLNLAPFSFFNGVTDDPPCVMFCPNGTHPDGGPKDSLRNVQETGEFVFNLSNWSLREEMNKTAEHMPRSVDEMAAAGLEAAPSKLVAPPRVAAAPAAFECKLFKVIDLPASKSGRPSHVVIGEVIGIHIDDSVIVDGIVDISLLQPIARLGYMDYAVVNEGFTMMRPD
ncbi:MAG: flavin reductase family protein [Alphaproteobacteria bacterium]|nr:flavin reductase family protein [Alphaproteobacteria bacterium]